MNEKGITRASGIVTDADVFSYGNVSDVVPIYDMFALSVHRKIPKGLSTFERNLRIAEELDLDCWRAYSRDMHGIRDLYDTSEQWREYD